MNSLLTLATLIALTLAVADPRCPQGPGPTKTMAVADPRCPQGPGPTKIMAVADPRCPQGPGPTKIVAVARAGLRSRHPTARA